jgi:hypothetical protein
MVSFYTTNDNNNKFFEALRSATHPKVDILKTHLSDSVICRLSKHFQPKQFFVSVF